MRPLVSLGLLLSLLVNCRETRAQLVVLKADSQSIRPLTDDPASVTTAPAIAADPVLSIPMITTEPIPLTATAQPIDAGADAGEDHPSPDVAAFYGTLPTCETGAVTASGALDLTFPSSDTSCVRPGHLWAVSALLPGGVHPLRFALADARGCVTGESPIPVRVSGHESVLIDEGQTPGCHRYALSVSSAAPPDSVVTLHVLSTPPEELRIPVGSSPHAPGAGTSEYALTAFQAQGPGGGRPAPGDPGNPAPRPARASCLVFVGGLVLKLPAGDNVLEQWRARIDSITREFEARGCTIHKFAGWDELVQPDPDNLRVQLARPAPTPPEAAAGAAAIAEYQQRRLAYQNDSDEYMRRFWQRYQGFLDAAAVGADVLIVYTSAQAGDSARNFDANDGELAGSYGDMHPGNGRIYISRYELNRRLYGLARAEATARPSEFLFYDSSPFGVESGYHLQHTLQRGAALPATATNIAVSSSRADGTSTRWDEQDANFLQAVRNARNDNNRQIRIVQEVRTMHLTPGKAFDYYYEAVPRRR